MAYGANQQLRDDIWDFRHKVSQSAPPPAEDANVVNFARQPAKVGNPTALDLVKQATELF